MKAKEQRERALAIPRAKQATEIEAEHRRLRIARLRTQGLAVSEIAHELDCSVVVVRRELQKVQERAARELDNTSYLELLADSVERFDELWRLLFREHAELLLDEDPPPEHARLEERIQHMQAKGMRQRLRLQALAQLGALERDRMRTLVDAGLHTAKQEVLGRGKAELTISMPKEEMDHLAALLLERMAKPAELAPAEETEAHPTIDADSISESESD